MNRLSERPANNYLPERTRSLRNHGLPTSSVTGHRGCCCCCSCSFSAYLTHAEPPTVAGARGSTADLTLPGLNTSPAFVRVKDFPVVELLLLMVNTHFSQPFPTYVYLCDVCSVVW